MLIDAAETLLPDARHVIVVSNPNAGARSRHMHVDQLAHELRQHDLSCQVISDSAELVERVAALQLRGELRTVVAAGGDGTAGEVVNRTSPEVPLALLPLGTENLLAKYLRIKCDPVAVARMIAAGVTIRLDAAQANQRIFFLMFSAGFDAEVVHRLDATRTGNISHWSYLRPILRTIRRYTYPPLKVYCQLCVSPTSNTQAETGFSARWVFVSNLPCYAMGLPIALQAMGTDALLDVCMFQRGGLFSGLKYLLYVIRKHHARLNDCQMIRCSKLRVDSSELVPYQIDGDHGGYLPVELETLPRRLRVLVTPDTARRLGFEVPQSTES